MTGRGARRLLFGSAALCDWGGPRRARLAVGLTLLCSGCVTTSADMAAREVSDYRDCLQACRDETPSPRTSNDPLDDSRQVAESERGWCRSDCDARYRPEDQGSREGSSLPPPPRPPE